MAIAGEVMRADELRQQLQLDPAALDLDSEQIQAEKALAASSYLPLRLPASSVLIVEDAAALSRYIKQ